MRAREFLREQAAVLPPEQANPMRYTYTIPGLSASDPYRNYRFGVALARARSDSSTDGLNDHMPDWHSETAFGEHGVPNTAREWRRRECSELLQSLSSGNSQEEGRKNAKSVVVTAHHSDDQVETILLKILVFSRKRILKRC